MKLPPDELDAGLVTGLNGSKVRRWQHRRVCPLLCVVLVAPCQKSMWVFCVQVFRNELLASQVYTHVSQRVTPTQLPVGELDAVLVVNLNGVKVKLWRRLSVCSLCGVTVDLSLARSCFVESFEFPVRLPCWHRVMPTWLPQVNLML